MRPFGKFPSVSVISAKDLPVISESVGDGCIRRSVSRSTSGPTLPKLTSGGAHNTSVLGAVDCTFFWQLDFEVGDLSAMII